MQSLPAMAVVAFLVAASGAGDAADQSPPAEFAAPTSDFANSPRRHDRVGRAARLDPTEAQLVYAELATALARGYRRSGHPAALQYGSWRRFNTAPYRSAAHGRHYVNNYANETAAAYGAFEDAGRLPLGSMIVKDSFKMAADGTIEPAPLFVMEKMAPGFNPVSGDWRYTMILPDGTLFGETNGENSQRVRFCISCHLAAEENDHLFFLPEDYRADVMQEHTVDDRAQLITPQ